MIREVLESWIAKIPNPEVECYVPYFPIPSPDGTNILSLAKVFTEWNSYIEEKIEEALKDPDYWWNIKYMGENNCDFILEQTRARAELIPETIKYILSPHLILSMQEMLAEMEEETDLSELIRDKMTEIFNMYLDILKEEYNACKSKSETENREVAGTNSRI